MQNREKLYSVEVFFCGGLAHPFRWLPQMANWQVCLHPRSGRRKKSGRGDWYTAGREGTMFGVLPQVLLNFLRGYKVSFETIIKGGEGSDRDG